MSFSISSGAGVPGTMSSVCEKYFDPTTKHEGCAFQKVCSIKNSHPRESNLISIMSRLVTPEILRNMADQIDLMKQDSTANAEK